MPQIQPQGPNTAAIRRRNKAVARAMLDCFNRADLDGIVELHAPDFFEHTAFPPGTGGVEGLKQQVRDVHAAFGDFRSVETSCIAEADVVVLRHRLTGVHRGRFLGVAPTGQRISYPEQEIMRMRDGLIVEHLGSTDILDFLDTLGVVDAALLEHPGLKKLRASICGWRMDPPQPPAWPPPGEHAAAAPGRVSPTEEAVPG